MTERPVCLHDGLFGFGCLPGVTKCEKCGERFGLEEALKRHGWLLEGFPPDRPDPGVVDNHPLK